MGTQKVQSPQVGALAAAAQDAKRCKPCGFNSFAHFLFYTISLGSPHLLVLCPPPLGTLPGCPFSPPTPTRGVWSQLQPSTPSSPTQPTYNLPLLGHLGYSPKYLEHAEHLLTLPAASLSPY